MAEECRRLPANWAIEWEMSNCMAFFCKEGNKHHAHQFYVVNKLTLKAYYVTEFPSVCPEFGQIRQELGCVYSRGKLYLVGDRSPYDVHVCDLLLPPPYVWTLGPPMHSAKHYAHIAAYNGMIFAISGPDKNYYGKFNNRHDVESTAPMATFEVWDTNVNDSGWVALLDPPLRDYNPSCGKGAYRPVSHVLLNDLLYFVFDYADDIPFWIQNEDSYNLNQTPLCYSQVEAFDPNLRKWVRPYRVHIAAEDGCAIPPGKDTEEDADDMLHMLINFTARRHETYDEAVEFFEGDPSLRTFMWDPTGDRSTPPCFYTYDISTFSSKTILKALRGAQAQDEGISGKTFVAWFQGYVRPYLSSVTGLSRLTNALRTRPAWGHSCYVLPCSYEPGCWNFCVVAFMKLNQGVYSFISKFRLVMVANCFQAQDFEMRIDLVPEAPLLGGGGFTRF